MESNKEKNQFRQQPEASALALDSVPEAHTASRGYLVEPEKES